MSDWASERLRYLNAKVADLELMLSNALYRETHANENLKIACAETGKARSERTNALAIIEALREELATFKPPACQFKIGQIVIFSRNGEPRKIKGIHPYQTREGNWSFNLSFECTPNFAPSTYHIANFRAQTQEEVGI